MNHLDRRRFLRLAGAVTAGAMLPPEWLGRALGADAAVSAVHYPLVRFPEKTALLMLTDRPPNLEMPGKYFREDITPNDAFFVRWHESAIATSIDPATFRLNITGHVERPMALSVDDLRGKFKPVSVVAVCQCSGNSRSLFEPRVTGGEWGHGAVGNAKWTGVPLRDLLAAAGMRDGAVDVSFAGLDKPPVTGPAPFVKSLDVGRANDGEVLVAYAMNDADLPVLNGYPLRLIVPGWYATYWVKSLAEITVLAEKFHGFWMDKAYRVPNNPEAMESPDRLATDTVAISGFTTRSLFAVPLPGARAAVGKPLAIEGVAFDSGKGIRRVEVSTDGGKTWADARLDPEIGKYSWRRWRFEWTPDGAGTVRLMARATSNAGQTQVESQWNRSGYARNVIEHVDVTVVAS